MILTVKTRHLHVSSPPWPTLAENVLMLEPVAHSEKPIKKIGFPGPLRLEKAAVFGVNLRNNHAQTAICTK